MESSLCPLLVSDVFCFIHIRASRGRRFPMVVTVSWQIKAGYTLMQERVGCIGVGFYLYMTRSRLWQLTLGPLGSLLGHRHKARCLLTRIDPGPKSHTLSRAPTGRPVQPHPTQENFIWMQRLSRSLSRLETQDIKTQPQINHYLNLGWSGRSAESDVL